MFRLALPVGPVIRTLAAAYDRCDTPENRRRLETATVWLASGGFLLHLGLIAAHRWMDSLGFDAAGLDRNYLHAVYTPFSFILFYEVLLLVLALPGSHTTSIGKLYEIISLITVRRVFKDIGAFEDPDQWLDNAGMAREVLASDAARLVLIDMAGAFLMFALVTAFSTVRRRVRHAEASDDLSAFVRLKKALALVMAGLFVGLAGWSLVRWVVGHLPGSAGAGIELDRFFFPEFFECMIFVDVFLFIVSIRYYERYEYVFRNAAFVISTVVLRLSLSTPKPLDVGLSLLAMVYGLVVLSVFAFFTSVTRPADPSREVFDKEDDDAGGAF